ncbi:unnamed protein product [Heligmosomoides polygyrus]|uniref:Uncharacterized protein n=1 Tax=Heligmosomoides polygyrus TaxID=6339 RepID=A0A183F4L5_HELPZ|nr:unnamed protein product [Heligmosomoides polygyrus]
MLVVSKRPFVVSGNHQANHLWSRTYPIRHQHQQTHLHASSRNTKLNKESTIFFAYNIYAIPITPPPQFENINTPFGHHLFTFTSICLADNIIILEIHLTRLTRSIIHPRTSTNFPLNTTSTMFNSGSVRRQIGLVKKRILQQIELTHQLVSDYEVHTEPPVFTQLNDDEITSFRHDLTDARLQLLSLYSRIQQLHDDWSIARKVDPKGGGNPPRLHSKVWRLFNCSSRSCHNYGQH